MVNRLKYFPVTRRIRTDWQQFADGDIYEFTPADGMYHDVRKFRTAARAWARRHGYTVETTLIPNDNIQPSIAIRFIEKDSTTT